MSSSQPKWIFPESNRAELKLYNSLTKSKVKFVPHNGNSVTWYMCGPTVYDAAHMGHARNYVSSDIVYRVLHDYFNYDVTLVMNITDIDDKIIIRARQNFLYEQFKRNVHTLNTSLVNRLLSFCEVFVREKFNSTIRIDSVTALDDYLKNISSSINSLHKKSDVSILQKALEAFRGIASSLETSSKLDQNNDSFISSLKDIISFSLDKEIGHTVTDPQIFRKLASYWEEDFFKDMKSLSIRRCDIITRVSEYIPQVILYIEKIISNGYAYEVNGSVYFDTASFDAHPNHTYAKLEPSSKANTNLIQDAEGALSSNSGKKNSADFALWKKSKAGEPFWDSPWGKGRPGWHIECSVMASEILGKSIDIHSGGIDLAFPHHDNELAQSEAYHGCSQWVNYFLHIGHVHIEGQKMSKSLKNFISIKEALKNYTARQIRIYFLLHQWNSQIDFSSSGMNEALSVENTISNFFINTVAILNRQAISDSQPSAKEHHPALDKNLLEYLIDKKNSIHCALCDNIDTPKAMHHILDLINQTNSYITASKTNINSSLLESIAVYITKIFKTFGVIRNEIDIGFSSTTNEKSSQETIMPYLTLLSKFRDEIRTMAINKSTSADILRICDKLRDIDLPQLGVLLDDQDDGQALIKLVDRDELSKAREQKIALELEQRQRKLELLQQKEKKLQEKLRKASVSPQQMFKIGEYENQFSKFDDKGIPTHDISGTELSKNRRKKLIKEWENQKKLHQEHLDQVNKNQ